MKMKRLVLVLVALLGAPIASFATDYLGAVMGTETTPYDEQAFVIGGFFAAQPSCGEGFSGSLAVGAYQPLQEITTQKNDLAIIPRVGFAAGPFETSLRIFISSENTYYGTFGGEVTIPTVYCPVGITAEGGYTFGWGLMPPHERYRLDGMNAGLGVVFGGGTLRIKLLGFFEAQNASRNVTVDDVDPVVSVARYWRVGPKVEAVFIPQSSNWCVQPSIGVGVAGQNLEGEKLDPQFRFAVRVFTRL